MDTGIRERGARKGRDGDFGCGAREGKGTPFPSLIVAKESVYIRKESNSHKRGLEHQPPA